MADDNPYLALIDQQNEVPLRQSLIGAVDKNPETESSLKRLSDVSGVPIDALRVDPKPAQMKAMMERTQPQKLVRDYPVLADFLHENAGYAHDDVGALTRVGDLLGATAKGVTGDFIGSTLTGAGALVGVAKRRFSENGMPRQALGALETGLTIPGQGWKMIGDKLGPPQARQNLGTDVAAGIGQLGGQIGTALLTGGISGVVSLTTMAAQGADQMSEKANTDKGTSGWLGDVSQEKRDLAIVAGSIITPLTEKYGLDALLNRVPPNIKNRFLRFVADKVAAGGIEAGQELTEGVLQDVAQHMLTNDQATWMDGVDRQMSAAGISAALVRSVLGVKGYRQAKQTQDFMVALGESSSESKLRQRLPEKFQELVERYTQDGPVQNVFVPADKFATYFQSVGMDPAKAASEVGASNYAEAAATGGDVVLPMAGFATHIAPTDHLQGLMGDLRLRQGDMTPNESIAWEEHQQERQQQLVTQMQQLVEEQQKRTGMDAAVEGIVSDTEGQLIAAGYDPSAARDSSTVMRGVAVLAQRAYPGLEATEAAQRLWDKYGLSVKRPMPDILTKIGQADADIYPMLDRLRAGDVPNDAQAFGQSLTRFLKGKGGVMDLGGELSGMDAAKQMSGLVNNSGMTFDGALELAQQHGYFPDGLNESSLIDAIRNELGGKPTYAAGQQNNEALSLRDTLGQLSKYLDEMGIDLSQVSNEDVVKRMQAQGDAQGGEALYQSADKLLAQFDEADTINIEAPKMSEQEIDDAETRFLSDAPAGTRYPRSTRLLKRVRRASEIAADDLRGSPKTGRVVESPLAGFSGYKVGGEVVAPDETFNPGGALKILVYGKEQLEAGLTQEPALTFTVMPDGEMMVNGPFPDGQTFAEFQKRGWAEIAKGAGGDEQAGWSALKDPSNPDRSLPISQVLPLLADVHARVRAWQGDEYVGLHWSRSTGALGGLNLDSNGTAVFFQSGQSEHLGSIGFDPSTRKAMISLFEKANLSTFLHETGHFYLEVMGDLADDASASPAVREDFAKVMQWMGVENRSQIETKHHELFARANEAYLREGKAPSPELRGVFQRFKAWLMLIYKQVEKLDVKINDELRGVFDRLYATDTEIEAARHDLEFTPLLTDAATANMSETEFAIYAKQATESIEAGKAELQTKLMRQFQREKEAWWKTEREKLRNEVAAEVGALPDQQAFKALVDGKMADGTVMKLNKADLVRRYGEEYLKRLPRGFQRLYTLDGGVDTDTAAEVFGFGSGDALVAALVNLRPAKALIEAETDKRMHDTHGDLLTDGTIAEEARRALHNDERAETLRIELRQLKKLAAIVNPHMQQAAAEDRAGALAALDSIPPMQAFRDAARGRIGQTAVKDIRPFGYLQAEKKAAKQAFAAMGKKDYIAAATFKQQELLNHALYREATAAKEEADGIAAYMRGLDKKSARERLGKAGADYLAQIDALQERYEFRAIPVSRLDRRQSMREWFDTQREMGFEPAIDPALIDDARQVNYKSIPMDELRAVRDAAKSIEHLARLKNRLLIKGETVEFNAAVSEMVESAEDNNGKIDLPLDPDAMTTGEKFQKSAGDWFAYFDKDMIQVRQLVRWLDGDKADGPWHRYLFNPASEAQTEWLDMLGHTGVKVSGLIEEHLGEDPQYLQDRFDTPLGPVTRRYLLSMAFNMGNASNIEKLVKGGYGLGENATRKQWTPAHIEAMTANLSAADWRFVQGVWDVLDNEFYPKVAELEKRVSGVAPEKIEARAFRVQTRDGETIELRGGYFPIKYDSRYSAAGQKQDSGPLAGLTDTGYASATTPRGHTKGRIDFSAPVLLDFESVLQRHLSGVIKDLTHREFLIDAQRLLRNGRIRQVLQERLGDQYEPKFMSWLRRIANDGNVTPDMTSLDRLIETGRTNAVTVALGFKVATMVSQLAGTLNAMEHPNVGAGWFFRGAQQFMSSPMETYRQVVEKSGEMRHRFDTIDRDVRDELRRMDEGKVSEWKTYINRAAFYGINLFDRMVSIPAWMGAYQKAIAGGMAEREAIHAADDAVVGSQGAGAAKDLSEISGKRGAMRLITTFMTPFAAQYQRLRDVGRKLNQKGMSYAPEAVMRVSMVAMFSAVLADLLAGRGPKECAINDAKCLAKWTSVKMAFSLPATVPLLRDVGNAVENAITGKGAFDIRVSPIIGMLETAGKTISRDIDVVSGKRQADDNLVFDNLEVSGFFLGVPTGQLRITADYLYDLMHGDEHPAGIGDVMRGLAFRRPARENK